MNVPPRAQLARVLDALSGRLPEQLAGLLEAARFDTERPALERLANPSYARTAAQAMTEAEAQWMADTLLARWAAIGEVVLDPIAAIRAPADVWVGRRTVEIDIAVAVDGLEDGWSATWHGASVAESDGEQARLHIPPPGDEETVASLRVKVQGRHGGRRTLLADQARIAVRSPRLVVREDRIHVLVRDQVGRPAARVPVSIGEARYVTDAHGLILLDTAVDSGTEVQVADVSAGRVP